MLVYTICLVFGLLFAIFSAVAGHFFDAGHDGGDIGTGGHAEAGADASGVPGMSFFSPTILACFVTAFGALGIIFTKIEVTSPVWASAPLSAVGAFGIALLVLYLFNKMFQHTQSSSESRTCRLAGTDATVISPIPANATGEIAYVQGGSRYNGPARSEDGSAIASGAVVSITRVVGSQFFVEVKKTTTQPSPTNK